MKRDELLEPGMFASVPKTVLADRRLSFAAKCTYAAMLDRIGQSENVHYPAEQYAMDIGGCRETVVIALEQLRKYRYITTGEFTRHGTAVYVLMPIEQTGGVIYTSKRERSRRSDDEKPDTQCGKTRHHPLEISCGKTRHTVMKNPTHSDEKPDTQCGKTRHTVMKNPTVTNDITNDSTNEGTNEGTICGPAAPPSRSCNDEIGTLEKRSLSITHPDLIPPAHPQQPEGQHPGSIQPAHPQQPEGQHPGSIQPAHPQQPEGKQLPVFTSTITTPASPAVRGQTHKAAKARRAAKPSPSTNPPTVATTSTGVAIPSGPDARIMACQDLAHLELYLRYGAIGMVEVDKSRLADLPDSPALGKSVTADSTHKPSQVSKYIVTITNQARVARDLPIILPDDWGRVVRSVKTLINEIGPTATAERARNICIWWDLISSELRWMTPPPELNELVLSKKPIMDAARRYESMPPDTINEMLEVAQGDGEISEEELYNY
jgi:hypothetical protein